MNARSEPRQGSQAQERKRREAAVGPSTVVWVSSGSGTCGWGLAVLMCTQMQSQMRKALTCSWFLPAGAWLRVSPSPELQEGQAVVLSCQVPTGVLEGTSYHWYRDGQPLQEFTSDTIRFAAITLSQAGAYHCQAQAPGSATTNLAAPVSLHVSCKHFDLFMFLGEGGSQGHDWGRGY